MSKKEKSVTELMESLGKTSINQELNEKILKVDNLIKDVLEAKETVDDLFTFQIDFTKKDYEKYFRQLETLNKNLNLTNTPTDIKNNSEIKDQITKAMKSAENFITKHQYDLKVLLYISKEKLESLNHKRNKLILEEKANNNLLGKNLGINQLYEQLFVYAVRDKLSNKDLSFQLNQIYTTKERFTNLINLLIDGEHFNSLKDLIEKVDNHYDTNSLNGFIPIIRENGKAYKFFEYLLENDFQKELRILRKESKKWGDQLPKKPESKRSVITEQILPFINPKKPYKSDEFKTLLSVIGFNADSTKNSLIELGYVKRKNDGKEYQRVKERR